MTVGVAAKFVVAICRSSFLPGTKSCGLETMVKDVSCEVSGSTSLVIS